MGKQERGEERDLPMSHLVLAIGFSSGIFQHLSVLLLKLKYYQSFASLVLPAGSPGARCRPASLQGALSNHPFTHPPSHPFTHSPTYPSTHPPPSPSLAQFGPPGLRRRGRGAGAWASQRRGQGLCSRGAAGSGGRGHPGVWRRRRSQARPSRHLRASLSHVTVASSLLPVARARAGRLDSRARSTGPSPREEKRRREGARRPGGAGASGGCRGRLFTAARVAVA